MPGERSLVCARHRIPEVDGIVVTPRCDCASIGTERDTVCRPRMPGKQGDLLMSSRIVEPNTDGTRYREPSAIGRIRDFDYIAFTESAF